MTFPGIVAHEFRPHDPAHRDRCDWLLKLVDRSPDYLAIIGMPHATTDEQLDAVERDFIRVYDLAKAERPDLGVKLLAGIPVGTDKTHVIAVVHEHEWVGGGCVRGRCHETRELPGAPLDDAA